MQTAPPGLPLVSCSRRHVEGVLDAHLFEGIVIGPGGGGSLQAPAAYEQNLHLAFERIGIRSYGRVVRCNTAAAEQTDVGELVEVVQRNLAGYHAAHRKAPAMARWSLSARVRKLRSTQGIKSLSISWV
jgi:hypothetical protein